MNGRTYTPNPGSVPGRAVAFFRANPEEELGIDDIVEKFDASRGNVHTLLGAALDASLLRRERNSEGEWIYAAGSAIAPVRSGSARDTQAVPKKKRPPIEVDPASLPIAVDVPLPGPKVASTRKKIDWNELLDRMDPGHSAELPIACRATLGKAIGLIHKETAPNEMPEGMVFTPRKFVVRADKDAGTLRVWREA